MEVEEEEKEETLANVSTTHTHTHKKVKGTVVNDNRKKKNLLLGALNTKSSRRTGQGDASNASVKWEKKKEKKKEKKRSTLCVCIEEREGDN